MSQKDWDKLEVNVSDLPGQTNLSAVFRAVDGAGSLLDSEVVSLQSGVNNYTLSVDSSKHAELSFNGTSSNATRTWVVGDAAIYNNKGGVEESYSNSSDWNGGRFNGTSADRDDNSGDLGIGYLDGDNPAADLSDDLIGYWRLDNTSGSVKDYSGNGHNGTNNGADRGRLGVFGTDSFNFNGSDTDHVNLGTTINFNGPDFKDEMAIAAWIYPTFDGDRGDGRIVDKSEGTSQSDHWYMLSTSSDPDLRFRLRINGSVTEVIASDTISADQWQHVAATYNGTEIRLYVDGELVKNVSESGEISTDTNNPTYIGDNPNGDRPWPGRIDEVQFYESALTDAEVTELYFFGKDGVFEANYSIDTIPDDTPTLAEVLAQGNDADRHIDMQENALQNVGSLRDGTALRTINFDDDHNVKIPHGDLRLSGGGNLDLGSPLSNITLDGIPLMNFTGAGNVDIPDGKLTVDNGDATGIDVLFKTDIHLGGKSELLDIWRADFDDADGDDVYLDMREKFGDFRFKWSGTGYNDGNVLTFTTSKDVRVPNGNLNMSLQQNNISNFFDTGGCPSGEVVNRVFKNGSYQCVTDQDTGGATENLAETLAAGNFSNGEDVVMNGSSAVRFADGIEIGDGGTWTKDGTGIAVGKFANASESDAIAIGNGTAVANTGDIVIGDNATVTGDSVGPKMAIGQNAFVGDNTWNTMVIGPDAQTVGRARHGVAIGAGSQVENNNAVAIGRSAAADKHSVIIGADSPFGSAEPNNLVGIGYNVTVEKSGSVAIGYQAEAIGGFNALAVGEFSTANGANTVAVGEESRAAATEAMMLGSRGNATAQRAVAIGYKAVAPNPDEATFGNLQGEELDVNVTGNVTVHDRLAIGNNSLSGMAEGDINVSTLFYDKTVAKSPVVACSQGSDWCHVVIPERQDSFYVKKGDSFDKDRPRATAATVVNASAVEAWQELGQVKEKNQRQEQLLDQLRKENRRQERRLDEMEAILCDMNPDAAMCS